MPQAGLPADLSVAAFDAPHDDQPAWRRTIEQLTQGLGAGPMVQVSAGTVLVALLGRTRVLKRCPPFLRDHFDFERPTPAAARPASTAMAWRRARLTAWP